MKHESVLRAQSNDIFTYVHLFFPCRSVLILNGNGADVAKHCVPAVPARRYNYFMMPIS